MKGILTLVALAQLVPPVLPANKQQRNERGKTQVLGLAFSLVCYYSLWSIVVIEISRLEALIWVAVMISVLNGVL